MQRLYQAGASALFYDGIAPAIVVGRLQHDGLVDFKNLNGLKVRLKWAES